MPITYSASSCELAASFSAFSIFIHSGENGKSCEGHVIFQDIEHQLSENILYHFLDYDFL